MEKDDRKNAKKNLFNNNKENIAEEMRKKFNEAIIHSMCNNKVVTEKNWKHKLRIFSFKHPSESE
jgi:hypothetical protein